MKRKILKCIAVYLAINFLAEIFFPTAAWALTGGPSQPEVNSFEPVGTSEMVDLSSGDFVYNIPLLDVGGYPINMSYHSGVSMDQEASWVGLGWNINVGTINRNMRGLPDDFNGDQVTKEFHTKANETFGGSIGVGFELVGSNMISASFGMGVNYNNYVGFGYEEMLNVGISSGDPNKSGMTLGLGLKSSSDGLDINPTLSYTSVNESTDKDNVTTTSKKSASLGVSINSRSGMKGLSLGLSTSEKVSIDKQLLASSSNEGGSSISFVNPTYVPQITMPMENSSISVSVKFGGTFFSATGTGNIAGYYSRQALSQTSQSLPAFGYLYSQNGVSRSKVLLDFNREKDGAFTDNTPCLPVTNLTYDLFTVTGQGVGGMFRPFRSDMGSVFDPTCSNNSAGGSLGLELSVGNAAHSGADIMINTTNSTTGKWAKFNYAAPKFKFTGSNGYNDYEPFYFKEAGEKSVDSDPTFFTNMGGSSATKLDLWNWGYDVPVVAKMHDEPSGAPHDYDLPGMNTTRMKREKRNQLFSFVTAGEYSKSGFEKKYIDNTSGVPQTYSSSHNGCGQHIAEITTYKTDGTRYVYGIPAYNTTQREVSFNASGRSGACGLVTYDPNSSDNSPSNHLGVDNYFSRTTLPAYAHSYLLTAVLSPDYVDVTGNGPSDDDYGTYTKFEYEKASDNYHWRVPYQTNSANYNEGLRTRNNDDQGSYVYGEKEQWYLTEIVTKNYITIFETDYREDGRGVHNEDGGSSSANGDKMKLLKKITLYSRPDYLANSSAAVPIKEVHFVYDYSLCTNPTTGANGVPNNSPGSLTGDWYVSSTNRNGKLTLKKIYFTYGKSYKAKLSPYEFSYRTTSTWSGAPFLYDLKAYDRWGNYKPNNCNTGFSNAEDPYVEQDKTKADDFTAAWSLDQINLPSGGIINIAYESDDYAYVQNKRATQMFRITGIDDAPQPPDPEQIYDLGQNSKLIFKLQDPISNPNYSDAVNTFIKDYLTGVDNLYFRVLINVNNSPNGDGQEYVSGYSKISYTSGVPDCGLLRAYSVSTGPYTYGYINLIKEPTGDNGTPDNNPIAKAAWQFARMHTPREAFHYDSDPTSFDVVEMVKNLVGVSLITSIIEAFQGPNEVLKTKHHFGIYVAPRHGVYNSSAEEYNAPSTTHDPGPAAAWIRLMNPNMNKLGGGCRVQKLTISDNWDAMHNPPTTGQTFLYGQEYTYKTIDPATNKEISSGVATYEPMVGADENCWKQPVFFSEKNLLAPDNDMYQEEPFGEAFFPSPAVTYSKVTVKNLHHTDVKRHATGLVVHEFYTSKDFPTIPSRTSMQPIRKKTDILMTLLKLDVKDYMTASQGFCVELNDMNGKPKAQWVYAEGLVDPATGLPKENNPISGVEYKYKSSGNRLVNDATTINKSGAVSTTSKIGIDYDFVADFRQSKTRTVSAGNQPNLIGFLIGIIPIVIPPIWPSFSVETTQFRSAVVTKVVFRYGILEETIAYDLGSKVSTKNLAYDSETGDVLLTRTVNEFDDGIYSLNYPGHWAYDGMGPAYKNNGVVLSAAVGTSGSGFWIHSTTGQLNNIPTSPSGEPLLVSGDEIELMSVSVTTFADRCWVVKKNNDLFLEKRDGNPYNFSSSSAVLKVIRSGRRNQQATMVEGMTCKGDPLASSFTGFNEGLGIINANAVIYTQNWRTFCPCDFTTSTVFNPYVTGMLGIWRKKKDFLYLTERVLTRTNENSNLRKDGTYHTYKPFWTPPSSSGDWQMPSDIDSPDPSWTWTSQVSIYSPYGFELENIDALGRFSSALYGYNNSLPTAVSSNAKYREIGFDSFEDYDSYDCGLDHFSFREHDLTSVTNTEAHSGKFSLKVPYHSSIVIEKGVNADDCPPDVQVQ